jgi:hypothetical protein
VEDRGAMVDVLVLRAGVGWRFYEDRTDDDVQVGCRTAIAYPYCGR